jgi:ABC-type glycerol-3-phosphate transport system substrate-binding protein
LPVRQFITNYLALGKYLVTQERKERDSEMNRRKFSRRDFLRVSALTTTGTILAGCAKATSTPEEKPPETVDNFEGRKVTVTTLEGPWGESAKLLVPVFQERTGAEVELALLSQTDFMPKVAADLSTGTGAYDVIIGETFPFHEDMAAGFIEPLEDYIASDPEANTDDFVTTLFNTYGMWEGKLYGLPYNPDVYSMYYRKDLFNDPTIQESFKEKNGKDLKVPETADELIEVARFFTKKFNPDSPVDYGWVFWGGGCGGKCAHWIWASRLVVYGGSYFDENYHPNFNNEAGMKAMEVSLALQECSPPNVASYNWTEMNTDFIQGKAAMMEQWPSIAATLETEESYLGTSEVVGKVGYAVPAGDLVNGQLKRCAVLGGATIAMSKYAKDKELAYRFLSFATSQEGEALKLQAGVNPCRNSSYEDESLLANSPEYIREFFPVIHESLKVANITAQVSLPPVGAELQTILGITMNKVWLGELEPQEALDHIEEEWITALKKEGLYK